MAHNIRSKTAFELSDLLNLCELCLTFHAETSHCPITSQTISEEPSDQDDRHSWPHGPETIGPTHNSGPSSVNSESLKSQHTRKDKKQYQQDYYRKNADKLKQRAKENYTKDKDRIKARVAATNRIRRLKEFYDELGLEFVPAETILDNSTQR